MAEDGQLQVEYKIVFYMHKINIISLRLLQPFSKWVNNLSPLLLGSRCKWKKASPLLLSMHVSRAWVCNASCKWTIVADKVENVKEIIYLNYRIYAQTESLTYMLLNIYVYTYI